MSERKNVGFDLRIQKPMKQIENIRVRQLATYVFVPGDLYETYDHSYFKRYDCKNYTTFS